MATLLSLPPKTRLASSLAVSRRPAATPTLVALLLVEVLALTFRFDSQALIDGGWWWSPLAGEIKYLPQALIAVLALGVPRLWSVPAGAARPSRRGGRSAALVGAHLAAFAGLAALTAAVWEGPLGRSPHATAWAAAWLSTALVWLALWLAAVVPAGAWRAVALRGSVATALVVGPLACYAGQLTAALWPPLAGGTLWLVRGMLSLAFRDVVFRPEEYTVGTAAFCVEIAPQCSGFEGIGLIWVFLTAYLWAFRRSLRFPRVLWLYPAGTAVMWLANAVRIAVLVALGHWVSPEVALGGFHSQAGWLAFNAVALGLVAVSRRARVFAPADLDRPEPGAAAANPTAVYLGPLLALVAAVMVTGALSRGSGFDALYPVRVVSVAVALLALRGGYAGLRWSWSWPALAVGAAAFAVWMALEPASTGGPALADGLARLPRPLAALWLAARVIGSVVTVPVAEELAFRGYLTRRLIAADFTAVAPGRLTWLSFLGSSLLFGAFHGRWVAGAIAGALYALAFRRKGRLSDAVLAHAATNALIAAYVLTTGSWSLWV